MERTRDRRERKDNEQEAADGSETAPVYARDISTLREQEKWVRADLSRLRVELASTEAAIAGASETLDALARSRRSLQATIVYEPSIFDMAMEVLRSQDRWFEVVELDELTGGDGSDRSIRWIDGVMSIGQLNPRSSLLKDESKGFRLPGHRETHPFDDAVEGEEGDSDAQR